MTKAAIAAQLIDIKNVSVHKCVRLTIDVPAEQAMAVINAFGWPTSVDPVPVAIARLNTDALAGASVRGAEARAHNPIDSAPRLRKSILAKQAGIACNDPVFRRYLEEEGAPRIVNENDAGEFVRQFCGVQSRADIILGTPAGAKWDELYGRFLAWRMVA